jgi:transcription initiation factor TFIIIB Brf1 subunit/transcription initiation factor TFIIB
LNPDVIQWGSLRELGPNNEVFSNADASLDQYILEGTLIVRNPAGVAVLAGMTTGAVVTTPRAAAQVKRYLA